MESIRRESSRVSRSSGASHATHGKQSTTSANGRPSILSKAYSTFSHRSSRLVDGASGSTSFASEASDSIQTSNEEMADKVRFRGMFDLPDASVSRPKEAAALTSDQERMYADMLQHFQKLDEFPCSLKHDDKRRQPASDWEKLRYLSRESLLRYLRATRWDVKAAQKRLTDTIAWHREFGTEALDPDEMAKEGKSGKETVLGFDNKARPLHYMHPHKSDTKESPRQMQYAVWILERCIDMMPPGVEQLALLINFEHKSRNPTSIANAKLMLYILQNHYVERLGIALCINVPWVFKLFWNAIQAFIDPVTKSKCRFDEAVKSEVPLSQLKADFGGNLDDKYIHDDYWPELVRVTDERRKAMLRRFKEHCNSEVGASEWVIRGGEDPSSPFNNRGEPATESKALAQTVLASATTSTDTPSAADKAAKSTTMNGSAPLEKFQTAMDTMHPNPIERTFSEATNKSTSQADARTPAATGAALSSLETTSEHSREGEDGEKKMTEAQKIQNDAVKRDYRSHTNIFKEMDRKIHASKLFAAFHPDSDHHSHRSSQKDKRKSTFSSADSPSRSNTQTTSSTLQQIPSAHEIVAVAGTSGPTAAAGAVGYVVAEQAKNGIQRVSTTASNSAAVALVAITGEDDISSMAASGSKESNEIKATKERLRLVEVLFFAAAKDAVGGRGKHQVTIPSGEAVELNLSQFIDHMLKAFDVDKPNENYDGSALRKIIAQSQWAVDETMVDEEGLDKVWLHGGESVAIIPPVSGG